MSIRRITISVPDSVAGRIKKAAGRTPVSAWVTRVIEERLEAAALEREWEQFFREVRPARADVRRADALLRRLKRRRRAAVPRTA